MTTDDTNTRPMHRSTSADDRPLLQPDPMTVSREPGMAAPGGPVPTATGPGPYVFTRRVMILLFGLVQMLITTRIVLLLLDAREGHALVSAILSWSGLFVGPFEGILQVEALQSAGSILDISAVLALIGWTILELIIIWALALFRREKVAA